MFRKYYVCLYILNKTLIPCSNTAKMPRGNYEATLPWILVYTDLSSIVKQAMFAYVNYSRIRSWNQPVLSNEGKLSCSMKQQEPLLGSNSRLTGIHQLRVRRATH